MINGSTLQDTTILNVHVTNNRASNYMRQTVTELQGKIDESTVTAGGFKTPLSGMGRSSRQKIIKDTESIAPSLNWM